MFLMDDKQRKNVSSEGPCQETGNRSVCVPTEASVYPSDLPTIVKLHVLEQGHHFPLVA
jgi:hypothetical protein